MANPVNIQSKSMLSRLLATENIFVIHDNKAKTASFDVKNRVLVLPAFKEMPSELYDMLIGHEVSHALYTPFSDDDAKSLKEHGFLSSAVMIADGEKKFFGLAHSYMNVVEDARIERLIKEKFAGLRRDFYIGYNDLHNRDFFGIAGKNVAESSFIDRINLHFKIGSIMQIPFTDEEMEFVKMVDSTRTFDDVLNVTKKIWNYVRSKKSHEFSNNGGTGSETILVDVDANGNGISIDSDKNKNNNNQWTDKGLAPDECITQRNYDEMMKNLHDTSMYQSEHMYHAIPKPNLNNIILDYKDLMTQFDAYAPCYTHAYSAFEADAVKFISESNQIVNILAQSFLSKKAAKDHQRNMTHRTGTIDTVRMMDYKFNDDIFRRMKIVKKGKSHGLVFFMDLSGSMAPVIDDTLKQLVQLVLFCKRVSIPFEVYGFTSRSKVGYEFNYQVDNWDSYVANYWEKINHPYQFCDKSPLNPFTLVNLFSSRMSKKELVIAVRNMIATGAYYKRNGGSFAIPPIMALSATPLIEAMVCALDIIPMFKNNNKLDIVHSVYLTDGEATCTGIHRGNNVHVYAKNHTYDLSNKYRIEDSMIDIVRSNTGARAVCFYLCDQKTVLPNYVWEGQGDNTTKNSMKQDYEESNKQYIREGWALARDGGTLFDAKFIIRGNNAVQNSDLEEILASKTSNVGIRNAFVKAMNANLVSRVMLNRFIDLIAVD